MKEQRSRGFSLIEILIVIVIIALLSAFLIPRLIGSGGKDASGKTVASPKQRAQQTVGVEYTSQINMAIQMYRDDHEGQNPPDLQSLKAYKVTDEMLLDPVTRQPLSYDAQTGTVAPSAGNTLRRVPGF